MASLEEGRWHATLNSSATTKAHKALGGDTVPDAPSVSLVKVPLGLQTVLDMSSEVTHHDRADDSVSIFHSPCAGDELMAILEAAAHSMSTHSSNNSMGNTMSTTAASSTKKKRKPHRK